MSTPNPAQRELVFCHECDNEFWKDEHGLECPACHSDFTEVIERSQDPRAPASPPSLFSDSLRNHNPWADTADVPDPDEDDVRRYEYHSPNGGFHFSSTIISGGGGGGGSGSRRGQGPNANDGGGNQPPNPLGLLGQMIAGMAQPQNFPQQHSSFPPGPGAFPERPRSSDGTGRPQAHFFTSSGPGFMFSTTAPAGNANNNNDGSMPQSELHQMLGNLFGQFGAGMGPAGHAGPDLNSLFQAVLNPANARHGDAVYSNEAFDRVLSQFMDEHQSSNAPGPASEAAIAALPRRPAGPAELGDEGKAECSICMDTITAGVEINVLPCSHWFHPDCVTAWLSEHDTCPVCRAGIMPKDGDQSRARTSDQAPLNDENPSLVARRQSGTQANPFIVPESPSRERRTPNFRRHSSHGAQSPPGAFPADDESGRQGSQGSSGGGGGFSGRMRSFFSTGGSGGGGSNSNNDGNQASSSASPSPSKRESGR